MERAIPILPTDDPEEAIRFYVDGLGFQVVFEAHYPNTPQQGTILGLERGVLCIHLDCPMPGHGRNACVYLDVDDADALYAEWSPKIDIDDPPEDQPWGSRTFTVMDPFGNSLFVVGPQGG
ncbi:MAG: VOC family protein [Lentisphaerae bacterium]|jgi:uncharacterized glyoxalase superfamily protein PhnB|nr:VOC family protein [Lentisphaerota bacterium]MBT4819943.1 VOC family protein [Lentisphaerota bacterium]MBT5612924.1 VOC family protein [Lentisphaerota bacterium]MBT7061858.1 VOC family protein [Lentisphaerota bacterium]MBT7846968.1 VOC family protein [Lentisphaerota bacterium]